MKKEKDIFLKSQNTAQDVADKFKNGTIENLFDDFVENPSEYEELKSRFENSGVKQQIMKEILSKNRVADIERLESKLKNIKKKHRFSIKTFVAATSVAAAFLVLSFWVWNNGEKQQTSQVPQMIEYKVPTIVTQNQIVAVTNQINQIDYLKIESGIVTYKTDKTDSTTLNELIVPSGFTQNVILEDGTEIILNAQSKLSYPTKFVSNTREVTLSGEAFFKVAKSKKPFIVKTKQGNVKVYGTEFNVYVTNDVIETLLVEGSVGMTVKDKKEIMITPNTLIYYNHQSNEFIQKEVDTQKYLGWVSGVFRYDEQNVERVLSDISKWFNVTFKYDKHLNDKVLSMTLHRDADIKEVVEFLEIVLNRTFILEERGIYKIIE